MPEFYAQWSGVKANFARSKELFPVEMYAKLEKGAGLGPALKTLDKAKDFEDRSKALASVRVAKLAYDNLIRSAIKEVAKSESAAHKALDRFETGLQELWEEADKLGQPPRPSGSTVPYEVIRGFNLANGFKPKFLDIKATEVNVIIELDKTLDALIKAGEESLKVEHLGDVAKAEVEKLGDAFSQAMKSIDGKMESLDLDKREKEVKEANETLKHYAKLVEDRVDEAVEAEWKSYLSRKAYLSKFRIKCAVKITLGTVAIGISVASAVLSFGTLWMNIFAIVKTISDIAQTLKTWAKDIDDVYGDLIKDIDGIHKLNLQREAAKKKAEGQKGSKTKEAAKELLTGLLPITKNLVKSASSVEDSSKQLLGLVSKLETQSDKLVGQLNAATKLMSKLPDKHMPPALKKEADKLDDAFKKLFAEIADLHKRSQNCGDFGEKCLKSAQTLRKEDRWTGVAAEKSITVGGAAVGLYAIANFSYECAKAGAALIPL